MKTSFQQSASTERRSFGRRESFVHAMILVPGRSPVPCIVRNFSMSGALLEFREPVHTPFTFKLRIDAMEVETACEVRRQTPTTVGVHFLDSRVAQALERSLDARERDPDANWSTMAERPDPRNRAVPPRLSVAELRRKVLQKT